MNKEENMEIRTLETFIKGVKEEGASEPCKYVQFNRQEAQRLLDYVVELQVRIDRIKNIYTSMQFAAPEIMHIFIEKLGNILEGEDNE